MMRILISIIVGFLFLVAGSDQIVGNIKVLLNGPAFLFVFGFAFVATLLQVNWDRLSHAYFLGLKRQIESLEVFQVVGRNFLFSGLLCALLGFARFVKNASEPDIIGQAVAFSLSSLVYSAAGYLFFSLCFAAANDNNENFLGPKSTKLNLNSWATKILIFFATLVFASFALKTQIQEVLKYPLLIAFFSGMAMLMISSKTTSQKQSRYFEQAAIIGSCVNYIYSFSHTMINLSNKDKIFDGFYLGLLSIVYLLLAIFLVRAQSHEGEQSISIENRELDSMTRVVRYYAAAAIIIVFLEFAGVIYFMSSIDGRSVQ